MSQAGAPYQAAADEKKTKANVSASFGLLKLLDHAIWHYGVLFVHFADYMINAAAVAFLSVDYTYIDWASKLRLLSMGCSIVYAVDFVFRLAALRTAFCRSVACLFDLFAIICVGGALFCRVHFKDDESTTQFHIAKYLDEDQPLNGSDTHKFPKYRSNRIEMYLAGAYCIAVALRVVIKPHTRAYSQSLQRQNDTLLISMESLRSALRRIPNITEAAIEMMENDLTMICGRADGDMTNDELMNFLEKAVTRRPSGVSASAFLSHLRDLDAQSALRAYGAADVIKSTLRHWSNQRTALACTMLVVLVHASVSPLLAYFMGILGDEAFPNRVSKILKTYNNKSFVDTQVDPKNHYLDPDNGGADAYFTYFTPSKSLAVGVWGILLICIPFAIADFSMGYFQAKMIAKATQRVQNSLLRNILAQPTLFFSMRTEGDLNNLFQSDIARVNSLWQAVFWNLMHPVVSVIAGFAFLTYYEPSVGMATFGFSLILISSGPQGHASVKSKEFGSKNAFVAAEFQNAVSCQNVVRAYDIQSPLLSKFSASTSMLGKSQFLKDFWSGIVQIYVDSSMYLFVSVMTAGMAMKVFKGVMTAGDFFSAVTLLGRVSTPVTVLGGFVRVAISNASSLQRLDEIVHDESSTDDDNDKNLPVVPRMKQALRIHRLSFQYDVTTDIWNLQEINATFPVGHYVCIVGPSGCGKSTLLGCLMRFYEPTDGSIILDNYNLLQYSRSSYLAQTAVVFQDGGILNGSIMENIRLGNANATDAECIEAAELAECGSFVRGLKDGYETIVGQHATVTLSGGQTQRICLARALVRKPTVLLLDEATSALDAETEASIIDNLQRLAKHLNMTVISVTHRLSTTRTADSILVMQSGRVVDRGTYHELLARPMSAFAELMNKKSAAEERQRRGTNNGTNISFTIPSQFAEATESNGTSLRALELFAEELRVRADSREQGGRRQNGSHISDSGASDARSFGPKRVDTSEDYVVL
ncbi:unnamed protein product [Aphanomyces euteiches]|uniref:ABC transporter domain-containing protein n=1 Tax=Aphanomyces euteiches TaxID=100861 RepID=A0A6G0X1H9_9STRA|nr:hypothetical protein Ae201684_009498 [Aphanomyces euteiches]KAH9136846.1 hypothetical protein AeRB84_018178 [Aphanomyces euteiches]